MKKFLCILLSLLLLTGCGADAAVEAAPEAVFPPVEIVEPAPAEPVSSEPVTLTMAVTGYNGMDQMVREFNLAQDQWRIVTYAYGDPMNGGKDLDVLRTELLAGNVPDLYCFCDQGAGGGVANGGIDLSKFGMDLLPLLDRDPEFVDYLTWCRDWGGDGTIDPDEKTILTMFPVQTTEAVRQSEMWREGYTYAGIPCYEGNGSMFELAVEVGISSQTEHADGAWAFIHYCLTRQDSGILRGIPVLQSVIEDQVEGYVQSDMDTETTFYATRDDADQFYELLNTTTVVGGDDQALLGIIKEEAEIYFQGSRTAEETAKLIQDRASLYVMEQYG